MRQLLQSLATGEVEVVETPTPALREGRLLIRSHLSLISPGTERMLVEFGRASLLQKARQQPQRVREVIDKVRSDGLAAAVNAVRSRLDEPLPLGYCNVGSVIEAAGADGFRPGDRVVCNGPHAEVVSVAENFCAKVPDEVGDEDAVFAVLGAIALQGVRLAEPTLGECFAVSGLGLIGLLTVQLLQANGCRVLGIDPDQRRRQIARQFGAETVDAAGREVLASARRFSRGRGVDGVLITAATTSDQPLRQAARMSRQRGRLVLVGTAGLNLRRKDFYEKELSFRVSCSYGPGRHDPQYEQGVDYPPGLVRWSAQRNFEAVLDLLAEGRLAPAPLLTDRFDFDRAPEAYRRITADRGCLGVILRHARREAAELRRSTVAVHDTPRAPAVAGQRRALQAAVIGAGAFAKRTLIPGLRRLGVEIAAVASQSGVSALDAARRHRAAAATSDWRQAATADGVDLVVIATRHDTHAEMACAALDAGKHVYLEKPLALNPQQLEQVTAACAAAQLRGTGLLMVGFNRRFAPAITTVHRAVTRAAGPKSFVLTVNAGVLPKNHWTRDPQQGGGRVIGEACHFIDLLRHLCGHPVASVQASMLGTAEGGDKVAFLLSFDDGSMGAVQYLGSGHRAFPKERLEVFCDGRVLQLDNFRRLRSFGWRTVRSRRYWRQDKGHRASLAAFVAAIHAGGPAPIPLAEIREVTELSFDVVRAAESGETIRRLAAAAARRSA